MISPNSLQISKNWWIQFPYHLRLITKIRFFAAFGAGGVIYLTSLIFNNLGLSATDIGLGFTISAIIGTVTRLFTGNYLNKTGKIQFPIITSSILSIAASLCLIFSRDTFLYIIGQSLVGAAAVDEDVDTKNSLYVTIVNKKFKKGKKMIEPLLCGIVLGLVPITLLGLFVSAWNQYRRGSGMLDID